MPRPRPCPRIKVGKQARAGWLARIQHSPRRRQVLTSVAPTRRRPCAPPPRLIHERPRNYARRTAG
eukprot:scaffold22865_cov92-Isochrysis_galbana.AAC.2